MNHGYYRTTARQAAMFEAIFEFEQSHLTDNVIVLDSLSVIMARELVAAGIAIKLPSETINPLQISIWNYQKYLSSLPKM